jgi:hypothetical protein
VIRARKSLVSQRYAAFSRTPFGCLLRLFLGRMFHGGGETGSEELGIGVGALLILLAMPGMLVSLLMFEKYGSLIVWMRGVRGYDALTEATPDEYFFIVLSAAVTGAIALWQWDSIFLDRRDHSNLVVMPVPLRILFLANFAAVSVLAALFALVVNAASIVLFPIAVVGSQISFTLFFRFAAGHAFAVLFASVFTFFAVFALAGLLMALLPPSSFRRVSLAARFLLAVLLLALLASVFAVPEFLRHSPVAIAKKIALLPPVSFLGLARTIWIGNREPFAAVIARSACTAFAWTALTAILAYLFSFRRSFLRIPETCDAGPLPRMRHSFSPLFPIHWLALREPSLSSCYHFVARTLLRSSVHLQVLSAFAAFGLVATVQTMTSIRADQFFWARHSPSADFLSIPFLLGFCVIVGIRCAFEIPVTLDANWIFKLWLPPDDRRPRSVARTILLSFSMPWLASACFVGTLIYFGWLIALLHTVVLVAACALLVEILLVRFRKIPFTCSYPPFQSDSGIILVAYLFGFLLFTSYLPDAERWALQSPVRTLCFLPIFIAAFISLRAYRKQILDMDKQLLFEEVSPSTF